MCIRAPAGEANEGTILSGMIPETIRRGTNMEKIQRFGLKVIAVMGAIIFGVLVYSSWTSTLRMYATSEATVPTDEKLWMNLLFTFAAIVICGVVGKLFFRMRMRGLHVLAVIISLMVAVCCFVLVGSANAYPGADQLYVYEAAENFYTGNYHNIQTEWYFNACPYQLGGGLIYGMLLKLAGSSDHFVIQCAQTILAGVIVYTVFQIVLRLFHSKSAAGISLLCSSCFLPMYLYTQYIYGETIGSCFALLSVLFLLLTQKETSKKWQKALFWGLTLFCMAVAYTVRLALVIVCIAMVIIWLLRFLTDKKLASLVLILMMLPIAVGGQKLTVSVMEKNAGVELEEGIPALAVIAMGIQDNDVNGTGPGSYNAYNLWLYYESGYDEESTRESAFLNIKQSLYRWYKDPPFMLDYMGKKMLNQWNEPTYGAFLMTAGQQDPADWVQELYYGTAGDNVFLFLNLYQGMVYAMLFLYFIWLMVGKREIICFLPGLILIGEFLFSAIWEAKSRYVYPYMLFAIPCVALMLNESYTFLKGTITKMANKRLEAVKKAA